MLERDVLLIRVDMMNIERTRVLLETASTATPTEVLDRSKPVGLASGDAILVVALPADRSLLSVKLRWVLFSTSPTPTIIGLEFPS